RWEFMYGNKAYQGNEVRKDNEVVDDVLKERNAVQYKVKCLYTFVYAANSGIERRGLWRNLCRSKTIATGLPWCLLEDMNVTLKPNEHSSGGSTMTLDMHEF
ncbi:hypothetical protein Tco_1040718, partial [Tanacetum coccineum]